MCVCVCVCIQIFLHIYRYIHVYMCIYVLQFIALRCNELPTAVPVHQALDEGMQRHHQGGPVSQSRAHSHALQARSRLRNCTRARTRSHRRTQLRTRTHARKQACTHACTSASTRSQRSMGLPEYFSNTVEATTFRIAAIIAMLTTPNNRNSRLKQQPIRATAYMATAKSATADKMKTSNAQ